MWRSADGTSRDLENQANVDDVVYALEFTCARLSIDQMIPAMVGRVCDAFETKST